VDGTIRAFGRRGGRATGVSSRGSAPGGRGSRALGGVGRGRRIRRRTALGLLQRLGGRLVRGCAVCRETRGDSDLVGCVGADTSDVGGRATGLSRHGLLQASIDAGVGLRRHTDCDQDQSSENAKGVDNHLCWWEVGGGLLLAYSNFYTI